MKKINIKEIVENLISTFLSAGKLAIALRKEGLTKEIFPAFKNGSIRFSTAF